MNLISFLDLLGVIFLAVAMWTILQPKIRKHKIFHSLSLLVILYALNVIPNALEWMGFRRVYPGPGTGGVFPLFLLCELLRK